MDYTKIDLCTNGKSNRFPPSITYDSESKISVSKLLLGHGNPPEDVKGIFTGDDKKLCLDPESRQPLELQLHILRKMFRVNSFWKLLQP